MFGEYESESPRVPSPWDSLLSSPRSVSPSKYTGHCNGNLATNCTHSSASPLQFSFSPLLLPRLLPENDAGNIEYKLHLLNPSAARFTRLVTQLKWRLLEGGGQAYYELGVADSGDLVGLGRQELESSLDTLEMMAGEIGASVIVVKEIEVPAELATRYEEDARSRGQSNTWGDARGRRARKREKEMIAACLFDDDLAAISSLSLTSTTNTEVEDSGVPDNEVNEDSRPGPLPSRHLVNPTAIFVIDLESEFDPADAADVSEADDDKFTSPPSQYAIDLKISSVYEPRPMRKRFHHLHPGQRHHQNGSGRSMGKKGKGKEKDKQHPHHDSHISKDSSATNDDTSAPTNRASLRRQARDRRREERKKKLATLSATEPTRNDPTSTTTSESTEDAQMGAEALAGDSKTFHDFVKLAKSEPIIAALLAGVDPNGSNAIVADTPLANGTVRQTVGDRDIVDNSGPIYNEDDDEGVFGSPILSAPTSKPTETKDRNKDTRSIVEVLVVRKMSIEEGFLDFEGFSFL